MGLLAILLALAFLMWSAYRGWSILALAPLAALLAVLLSGQPLMPSWTITFMGSAASFIADYFPLFLLGALFGKLMDDSGALRTIADFMTTKLGPQHAILAVVLAGALVTYGGVSLFVAFFVLAPMAHALFKAANLPVHLMPAAILLGTSTFTMTAMPGTPSIQNAIPMPFFKTTPFAAPGISLVASVVMLAFGLWWLGVAERRARLRARGYANDQEESHDQAVEMPLVRERAATAREFDPAELHRGSHANTTPGIITSVFPLCVVIGGNLFISLVLLPRFDAAYLDDVRWGGITIADVGGVWAVLISLAAAIVCLLLLHGRRIGSVRNSVAAGVNAAALPVLSVASLVGFGSVVATLPAFMMVRDWILQMDGGPLVSIAVATNLLAALTGSASGGLTIALDALSGAYLSIADVAGLDPALLHRIAVMAAGTLDSLPHNGAVVSLLAVCGVTHKEGYPDMIIVGIVGPILALIVAIVLGSTLGSF